jgi:hypothetical protein
MKPPQHDLNSSSFHRTLKPSSTDKELQQKLPLHSPSPLKPSSPKTSKTTQKSPINLAQTLYCSLNNSTNIITKLSSPEVFTSTEDTPPKTANKREQKKILEI